MQLTRAAATLADLGAVRTEVAGLAAHVEEAGLLMRAVAERFDRPIHEGYTVVRQHLAARLDMPDLSPSVREAAEGQRLITAAREHLQTVLDRGFATPRQPGLYGNLLPDSSAGELTQRALKQVDFVSKVLAEPKVAAGRVAIQARYAEHWIDSPLAAWKQLVKGVDATIGLLGG